MHEAKGGGFNDNGSVETSLGWNSIAESNRYTLAPGWEIFIEEEENCEV